MVERIAEFVVYWGILAAMATTAYFAAAVENQHLGWFIAFTGMSVTMRAGRWSATP